MSADNLQGMLYVPNIIMLICTIVYGLLMSFNLAQPSLFGNLIVVSAIVISIIRLVLIQYADKYERIQFANTEEKQ